MTAVLRIHRANKRERIFKKKQKITNHRIRAPTKSIRVEKVYQYFHEQHETRDMYVNTYTHSYTRAHTQHTYIRTFI